MFDEIKILYTGITRGWNGRQAKKVRWRWIQEPIRCKGMCPILEGEISFFNQKRGPSFINKKSLDAVPYLRGVEKAVLKSLWKIANGLSYAVVKLFLEITAFKVLTCVVDIYFCPELIFFLVVCRPSALSLPNFLFQIFSRRCLIYRIRQRQTSTFYALLAAKWQWRQRENVWFIGRIRILGYQLHAKVLIS